MFLRELTEGMLYSETVVAGPPEFRPERRHHRRDAGDHPQGLEPGRARGLRDRAHAQAQEGHRRAQGAGLSARLRHVRGGMPQGRARLSGRGVRGDDDRLDLDEARHRRRSSSTWSSPPTSSATSSPTSAPAWSAGSGLAPGLCVGEKQAMAQATHGSAPDIAGRNIANPYAMIMSGQMLLAWLGRKHNEPKATAAAEPHPGGGRQGDRRGQAPDPGSGRQGQHPGDGRRHRRRRARIAATSRCRNKPAALHRERRLHREEVHAHCAGKLAAILMLACARARQRLPAQALPHRLGRRSRSR